MRNLIVSVCALLLALTGCTSRQPHYRIGMSQCFDDEWRQKMNDEMDCEILLHSDMSLTRRIAYGSNALQCAQIDSFITEKIDVLIVSPNDPEAVRPAIARAYRAGIPVVIADRRIEGDEWTAFVGGDNYNVGRLMAQWVCGIQAQQKRPIHVLEVLGMPGSIPEQLRHQGLMDGIAHPSKKDDVRLISPKINNVLGCYDAYSQVLEYLKRHPNVDAIVAQNDIMAVEAAKAVNDAPGYGKGSVRIMGVDGIIVGLQALMNGDIECTAVYPSRGDLLIRTAAQIIAGEPFVRDTVIETMMIDAASAYPLLRQYEVRMHELETMRIVRIQSEGKWRQMDIYKNALVIAIILISLLVFSLLFFVILHQRKIQSEIKKEILPQLEDVKEVIQLSRKDEVFAERLRQTVDDHLMDANLNVEYLAELLQLDRSQLFRRVKSITGKGPMEYIRERRLIRAYDLLLTTDKTVRQISMELQFASPSYFSKYFKEYYGNLPNEI